MFQAKSTADAGRRGGGFGYIDRVMGSGGMPQSQTRVAPARNCTAGCEPRPQPLERGTQLRLERFQTGRADAVHGLSAMD